MVDWHHQLEGHEPEQALEVGNEQGSLACCSPWGRKELDTTKWLDWGCVLVFPGGTSSKESTRQCGRCKRWGCYPWVGKIPWKRKWQPTTVVSPGESHGQRSLVSYSPWGHKDLLRLKWQHIRKMCVIVKNGNFKYSNSQHPLTSNINLSNVWKISQNQI